MNRAILFYRRGSTAANPAGNSYHINSIAPPMNFSYSQARGTWCLEHNGRYRLFMGSDYFVMGDCVHAPNIQLPETAPELAPMLAGLPVYLSDASTVYANIKTRYGDVDILDIMNHDTSLTTVGIAKMSAFTDSAFSGRMPFGGEILYTSVVDDAAYCSVIRREPGTEPYKYGSSFVRDGGESRWRKMAAGIGTTSTTTRLVDGSCDSGDQTVIRDIFSSRKRSETAAGLDANPTPSKILATNSLASNSQPSLAENRQHEEENNATHDSGTDISNHPLLQPTAPLQQQLVLMENGSVVNNDDDMLGNIFHG